jgi:hypothetical protein
MLALPPDWLVLIPSPKTKKGADSRPLNPMIFRTWRVA